METMINENIPAARRFTLRKAEKLRHKNLVNSLFNSGKSIYEFPIRLVWKALSPEELRDSFRAAVPEQTGKMQMLITIPKKKRKRAVDRVLLRRRIREAYRLNRTHLADVIEKRDDLGVVSMAFIFLGEENTPYATLEKKMINLLERLEKKLAKEEMVNADK
ncbi:MAG: ribonuclease P protein component [Muribaculaceae bacterium]|nr:ribonuclease P protein component [Muribaculaceae bacterium]